MKSLKFLLLLVASTFAGTLRAATPAPNFLLIIADDFTFSDVGCYGGQAYTPTIDTLARDGLKFTRCFQAAPMCSPTRHALYTGMYPIKTGAYPNHTFVSRPNTVSLVQRLRAGGYRVALAGKSHVGPAEVLPFEPLPDPLNGKAHRAFLASAAQEKKPFCLIVASHNPHSPWTQGDRSRYDAAKLRLPPDWADTPETRDDFRNYLAECTALDAEVADALAMLTETGRDKDTVVVFLSEQGTSLPRAKWNLYDRGIQSACLIRWPGNVRPGTTTAAMIEYVDILPTFLEIAGQPRTPDLDGRSFLPVLRGATDSHKEFVFAQYTNRGVNNGSDHYGIRSVRSARYKYIWNFTPGDPYANASMKNATYASWVKAAAAGDSGAQAAIHRLLHRTEVEFYDVLADPGELKNLSAEASLAPEMARHRAQLDAWMQAQGDRGQATEMEALQHMKRYVEDPGAASGAPKQKKKTANKTP
jgi:uncharacterized sulfatase